MTYAFTDRVQIEELPDDHLNLEHYSWTDETVNEYLETEAPEEEEGWDLYGYDDDQALEEYSLECAFGPEE